MLRVAVIGTGAISGEHIRAYLAHPSRCRIVRLVDTLPQAAEARRREFGLDCAVSGSLDDTTGLDLVSVCTPPHTHATVTIPLLERGVHVLCEKPMAPSLAECDAMLDAAVRGHARLSVVAQNRFRTDVRRLHHLLASGAAGEILHAQVDSHWWRGHSYYDLWWRGTWAKEGGGCTLNHAVHHIDMLLWMMGLPDEVTAAMTNVAHDNAEVEDLSVALLRYKTGAIAQITSSVIHHGEEQQLIFQCRDARVSFPWRVCATTSRENGFGDPAPEREQALTRAFQELPPLDREGHAAQITDVLDAIEQGHPLTVDGAQGRNPVELVTAIYKSATTGVPVKLPLDPGDPWCVPGGIARLAPRFFEKKRSVEQFRDNRIVVGSSRDETDAHAKG